MEENPLTNDLVDQRRCGTSLRLLASSGGAVPLSAASPILAFGQQLGTSPRPK
jgi:hypothetical protein